jgi:hypothetical protein
MLSKCANPACTEQFRYLHQGKLFTVHLAPDSCQVVSESWDDQDDVYERFWLCDKCCERFTVIWEGLRARIVELPAATEHAPVRKQG